MPDLYDHVFYIVQTIKIYTFLPRLLFKFHSRLRVSSYSLQRISHTYPSPRAYYRKLVREILAFRNCPPTDERMENFFYRI